ncbi:hypothetical protein EBBID32_40850 [Sphingobium indicum BiD32]|uniref:Uncharacterized protein n=1 Tax=Sphingobium indicum BiD32 TaxID=1301087 RepID=N1MR93_9SPHN|nr:hypothetical protein EBBID32_40850 [Sphingobium indicum BiD32]
MKYYTTVISTPVKPISARCRQHPLRGRSVETAALIGNAPD